MPRRNRRLDPTQLRAYDEGGNVRPADPRYLDERQAAARAALLDEVEETPDEALSLPEATPDPGADQPTLPEENPA